MSLPSLEDIIKTSPLGQEILSETDYALRQTLARQTASAIERGIDSRFVARAMATMLLVAAARQALSAHDDDASLSENFPLRASEALASARVRREDRE